jgi:RND family efflux transporter MFP subunit
MPSAEHPLDLLSSKEGRLMICMRWLSLLVLALSLAAAGCNRKTASAAAKGPPEVDVSTPVADTIRDWEVFTGRTQAIQFVDLRARVTGYLDRVSFKEGDDVSEGQELFRLQLKPFQLAVEQARANIAQQQAQLTYNQLEYRRYQTLRAQGAMSPEDVEKTRSNLETTQAALKGAQAALEIAQQNLDWATVRAPFTGRIGRRQVDPGNDVIADSTILASVVQIDPLYAYFDIDERTLLRIRELFPGGKVPADAAERFPVLLGLANEKPEDFSHPGKLKFGDNRVDANTGTLRMWGTFENPKHDLYPGLFIRVRMGVGTPRPVVMVSEAALGSDQGRKVLYVLDKEDKVSRVPVEIGQRKNGLIAVEQGVSKDDRIVVNGLQTIRDGAAVVPKLVPMPRAKAARDLPVSTSERTSGNTQGQKSTGGH